MESHFLHCYLIHYIREAAITFYGVLTCNSAKEKLPLRMLLSLSSGDADDEDLNSYCLFLIHTGGNWIIVGTIRKTT